MRLGLFAALLVLPAAVAAQSRALSASDSALVGRILVAEDRRDSSDTALMEGSRHSDLRVRVLSQRALGRIREPRFAVRDSLPPLAAPTSWREPAWRVRYRALAAQRGDCDALRVALADSAWPVRLRAADLSGGRSEEHTSELQSRLHLVCRLLLEKKNIDDRANTVRTPS